MSKNYFNNKKINNKNNNLNIYIYNVYLWMSYGLLLTSFTAWYLTKFSFLFNIIVNNHFLVILLLITQFTIVIILTHSINKLKANTATILFIVYSILTGISISSIFLIYNNNTIYISFFISSIIFLISSIVGFITKKDLTNIGNLSIIFLTSILICSLINIILKNSYITLIMSYIGIIIFIILTTWDTQKLKEIGINLIIKENDQLRKYSILGALLCYLNFINIYLLILKILNNNKTQEEENNKK